jgi:hypothetical protein
MEGFIPIKDFETWGISKEGEVMDFRKGKIKEPSNIQGYKRVGLENKNGWSHKLVHRLVAEAFLEKVEGKDEVDHIDRDRSNNNVYNLRWADDFDQNINKCGWGKYNHKHIWLEDVKTKKNPTASWVIMIRNKQCKFRKRYNACDYSLEDVIKIRNKICVQHNLPITD